MNSKIFPWILKGILILLICFFAIATVRSIMRPQKFKMIYDNRLALAKQRLITIRTIQNVYRNEFKKYATSVDTLVDFIEHGMITIVSNQGFIPEGMGEEEALKKGLIKREMIKVTAKSKVLDQDSTLVLDNFQYVPLTNNKLKFVIKTASIKGKNFEVPTYCITVSKEDLLRTMDRDIHGNSHNSLVRLWNKIIYSNLSEETSEINKYKDVIMGSLTEAHTNGNWE